jgi:hypothetical protein
MNSDIADQAVFVVSKGQFSCPLGDAIVLLDVKAGLYFSLDNVGAAVWKLLQEPRTFAEICDSVLGEFDVTADVCRRDVAALLRELADRNLVETRDAAAA